MSKGERPGAVYAVTDDAFLGGRLAILQPRQGYRAGVDAVLLAAAAPVADGGGETVLDVGAGVGTVGLCVARRVPGCRVVLLEREAALVELAQANIVRNGLQDRVTAIGLDVTETSDSALAEAGILVGRIDHVLANPPFHTDGDGTRAADVLKARAHAMAGRSLERWARFLARVAAPGGSATVIHKAEALGELLAALDGRFGGIRVKPVQPRAGEPAIRVIVQGRKGSRAPLVLLPPLVLHEPSGGFTDAASAMLRHGAALPLSPQGNPA